MRFRFGSAVVAALALWLALPGLAQADRKGPVSVEVGKSQMFRLEADEEPAVIFVGNPFVADVILERGGVVFVLGREPGQTDLWLLDDDGNTLMHRALVVTPQWSGQISVLRGRQEQTLACSPRCAQIPTPVGDNAGAVGQPASVIANPPEPDEPISTEELIESLRELIPELSENRQGGGGAGGARE